MRHKIGKRTLVFAQPIPIVSYATVVGPKEMAGPMGGKFDFHFETNLHGEASWEKAEQKLQQYAVELALEKKALTCEQLDFFLGGDLLNQIIATSFTARSLGVPYLGLYGACSTLVEGMIISACLIDGGFAERTGVCSSSHHDAVERQLRYPTEMGVQRTMTAQWTVTGAGAYILGKGDASVAITHAIPGKVVDLGVSNNMDMGTAMASAAADTIVAYLEDAGAGSLGTLDYIVTGDLGKIGLEVCRQLVLNKGYDIGSKHLDCGLIVYSEAQDTHAGGSGCGCSATVLGAYFLPMLEKQQIKKILLVGTGALLSPTSTQQGETIPGIAHGVVIEYLAQGGSVC